MTRRILERNAKLPSGGVTPGVYIYRSSLKTNRDAIAEGGADVIQICKVVKMVCSLGEKQID